MAPGKYLDHFVPEPYFAEPRKLKKARLLVRASFLTSLFSNTYIWLSLYFDFAVGVNLMVFNFLGFFILPWLVRLRLSLKILGNAYVAIGAIAVIVIPYYSGGMWSAVYPWIIAVPVLALLVVDEKSGIYWGIIGYVAMMFYAILAFADYELPNHLKMNIE